MQDAGVRGTAGGQMNRVVDCGTDSIVAGEQPLESYQRQPAVGLLKVGGVLHTPCGEILLPGSLLRQNWYRADGQINQEQCNSRGEAMTSHRESIVAEAAV